MNEKVLKCLYDIKIAIDEINLFIETGPKDLEDYKKNFFLRELLREILK